MRNIDIYSNTMETRALRRNAKENGKISKEIRRKMLRIYALRRNAKENRKKTKEIRRKILRTKKGKEGVGGDRKTRGKEGWISIRGKRMEG